jgi:hypothetical protein
MGIWVHPHAHADIPLEVRGGFLVWLSLSDVVQTPIDCIHTISYVYTVFQHLDDNGNGTWDTTTMTKAMDVNNNDGMGDKRATGQDNC